MSVVSIERSQRFSALRLISAVERLAGASLIAQARALVIERQPAAAPFSTDATARAMLSVRQSQLRARAGELLNSQLPACLAQVTDMQSFVLLLLEAQKGGRQADPTVVAAILGALAEQARVCERRSASLAAQAADAAADAAEEQAELDGLIEAEVRRINADEEGGDDGELARVRAQIDQTSEAMSAAVQATVDSSRKAGSGVGRIVTWVSSLFSFQAGHTTKKPAKDGDDASEGGDGVQAQDGSKAKSKADKSQTSQTSPKSEKGAKPHITPERPTQNFPVTTIGEIGDDTAAVFDARSKLNSLVIQQRQLYVQLYRAEAGLAVMQVVGQQGQDLIAALRALGSSVEAVRAEWQRLAADCEQASGTVLPFDDSWTRLSLRIDALLKPFTTGSRPVPHLDDIDSCNH